MGGHVVLREDHGLPAESAGLGAANVEDLAEPREFREPEVAGLTPETVAETRSVNEERNVKAAADIVQGGELLFRIERAVFRGKRDVHEAGKNHVVAVAVGAGVPQEFFQGRGRDFPFGFRKGKHLVAG